MFISALDDEGFAYAKGLDGGRAGGDGGAAKRVAVPWLADPRSRIAVALVTVLAAFGAWNAVSSRAVVEVGLEPPLHVVESQELPEARISLACLAVSADGSVLSIEDDPATSAGRRSVTFLGTGMRTGLFSFRGRTFIQPIASR